jgi:hypothetical protein
MFKDVSDAAQRLVLKSDAGAEYHLGLGAAMNVGILPYIDSRIAVHLYRALPEAERPTIGAQLLTQATKTSGFNPEPWYLLAKQTTSLAEGTALAERVAAHLPAVEHVERDKKKSKGVKKFKVSPGEHAEHEYWETLNKFVVKFGVTRHGAPPEHTDGK